MRLALYADPKLKNWDYVIYPYFMYKFTNGVSTCARLCLREAGRVTAAT